ncbi:BUD32 family EKC/KEOPS complex subunit [Celerinatantimonas yamalensis]|uniref:tRNA A-37 threonylcarbamoyl transferase component Bud32 n=1 Tax=Celerinatantimonas yamalensis TaxID=559956 RepID=A0ABW9G3C8_9GAMM
MYSSNNSYLQSIYDSQITEKMLNEEKKVEQLELGEQLIWIKRPEATRSNLFHRIVHQLTKLKILVPVERKTPLQSLNFEALKLKTLARSGISVAEVIGQDRQFLYLSDTGTDLRCYFKKNPLSHHERTAIILKAVKVLAAIHQAGHYHGGAQIKNYTIDAQGVVSAIDFEDSFSSCTSLIDTQYRDLFLFLMSLSAYGDRSTYRQVIDCYFTCTGNDVIKQELQQVGSRMKPLVKLLGWMASHHHLSLDVIGVYSLLSFLTTL